MWSFFIGVITCVFVYFVIAINDPDVPPPQLHGGDTTNSIKIIHQIWFQGADVVPERYTGYRSTCTRANPGWEMKVHDEASLRAACAVVDAADSTIGLVQLFDDSVYMHEKIDAGRMAVLYNEGGISVDMDMLCGPSFETLLRYVAPSSIGLSAMPVGPLASLMHNLFATKTSNSNTRPYVPINNATWVLPARRSPALLKLIRHMADAVRRLDTGGMGKSRRINLTWGPSAVSVAVAECDCNVTLFPKLFIEQSAVSAAECTSTTAHVCHVHEFSWISGLSDSFMLPAVSLYLNHPILVEVGILALVGGTIASVGSLI
jgi:hypothetical protein